MGATGTKLDRKPALEAQALASVRQLLVELGSARGMEELVARGTKAHLERELGLGSLERVELMLRLGDACGVRLPDRVVAEADTVQDLVDAILRVECRRRWKWRWRSRRGDGAEFFCVLFCGDCCFARDSPATLARTSTSKFAKRKR